MTALFPPTEPVLVDAQEELDALARALIFEPLIALDTESNSLHVYRERVCLIQLSTRQGDFVLDPLRADPRPLGPALARAGTVVLHGADYDVRCLKREYGIQLPGLFDTMAAARRLGRPALGLKALVEHHFGVALSKDFQRSDWGRRPLSAEQVRYAALDTHFLLPLYELLKSELASRSLLEPAREEFSRIAGAEPRPKIFDPEGWRHIKGAMRLDVAGRAVLRALWAAREERAMALDRPPFKIMGEATMVEVAAKRPREERELLRISGVSPVVLRRMGDALLSALEAAARGEEPV
ncbi:MAG TPA: ribonuclease D [Anaeromyxobacteraceae bacterium]|nr:ribonuclease D [Anaeromyxobacteraceae bacterium]